MAIVSEVAEGVYHITPHEPPSICSDVYLIADERPTLIESGPAAIASSVLDGMAQLGYAPDGVSYIALTHIHLDHAGGAGYLAQQLPDSRVIIHSGDAHHLIAPERLVAGTREALGDGFTDEYGPILPVPEERTLQVQGGESISLGRRELRVIHSPGHTPHHLCFYLPDERGLFSGDALGVYFPDTGIMGLGVAPPTFDLELSLATADQLQSLEPAVLWFSHFGAGRDTEALNRRLQELTRGAADLVLQSVKSGFGLARTSWRLEVYLLDALPAPPRLTRIMVQMWVQGYIGYFKKKGLI